MCLGSGTLPAMTEAASGPRGATWIGGPRPGNADGPKGATEEETADLSAGQCFDLVRAFSYKLGRQRLAARRRMCDFGRARSLSEPTPRSQQQVSRFVPTEGESVREDACGGPARSDGKLAGGSWGRAVVCRVCSPSFVAEGRRGHSRHRGEVRCEPRHWYWIAIGANRDEPRSVWFWAATFPLIRLRRRKRALWLWLDPLHSIDHSQDRQGVAAVSRRGGLRCLRPVWR